MTPTVCLGVALKNGSLVVASCQLGQAATHAVFPASSMGAEAIRVFLDHCDQPIRLAVTVAELDFALGWTNGHAQETFVVSAHVQHDAPALARFAAHA